MADGHGGYRKPSNPAAVSGPGALSRRTDGRPQPVRDLSNAKYGENKGFRELQQAAPMANSPQPGAGGGAPAGDPFANITPLGAPTAMPDVPVTDGANAGPGVGMDALGLPTDLVNADAQELKRYLPMLIRRAQSDDATPSFKRWVRILQAQQ